MALLDVKNLRIDFDTRRGLLSAVRGLDFVVDKGETLGIVGESGCGKSITSMAVMGLLADNAHVSAEALSFENKNLLELSKSEAREIRGGDIAMIFQDPMTSLNPSFTVGFQVMEAIRVHQGVSKEEQTKIAIQALADVGIPDPASRLDNYPHQLSGGMCQRVMIAMAIACKPKLLIADEPTTALDVTIQAQILQLLKKIQKESNMAMILITHDIAVVAQMADRIQVMYAGEIIESGNCKEVIESPLHPYTHGLLNSLPGANSKLGHRDKLPSIPGMVPDLLTRPSACQFAPRCTYKSEICERQRPKLETSNHRLVSCFHPVRGEK